MTVEGRREESGVPMMNGLPSADISTGIAIAWGICAALYARERTGRGQCINTTLMGSALAIQNTRLMSIEAVDTDGRETALAKINEMRANGGTYKEQLDVIAGVRPAIGNIYYRCFKTADGFIAVGCLSTPLRRKLLDATGLEDWRVGKRPDEIDPTDPETSRSAQISSRAAKRSSRRRPRDEWMKHPRPARRARRTRALHGGAAGGRAGARERLPHQRRPPACSARSAWPPR